jgi:uncharacterized protein YcbX
MVQLVRVSVTPLKGTALHHPEGAELTTDGIPWNRRLFLVDERGGLVSGGHHGPLVQIQAGYDPATNELELRIPGSPPVAGRLEPTGAPSMTDFYGRPVPGRFVEGPFASALGSYLGRQVRLVLADRHGDGSDVHRLSLVGRASVRDLGSRSERPDLDPRRFRMDLEIDGTEPFEEDTWEGRQVRVGEAIVRILGQIPRCVVTTHDPETGRKDFDTLKRIAEYRPLMRSPRGVPFGMYAEVTRPGQVRVGDRVEPLAAADGLLADGAAG